MSSAYAVHCGLFRSKICYHTFEGCVFRCVMGVTAASETVGRCRGQAMTALNLDNAAAAAVGAWKTPLVAREAGTHDDVACT